MVIGEAIVGVDESGKGDFFGPLVVAGFLCERKAESDLFEIGVRDSKKITDKRILEIDARLTARFPHAVQVILPLEYNQMYARIKNLNTLLADVHAHVISKLCSKHIVSQVVVDQFGKSELVENALKSLGTKCTLHQQHRGEQVTQVAAASILARAEFIRQMEKLSAEVGKELLKGAAPQVDRLGVELVEMHGVDVLERVSKMHFKNYQRVVNPRLFA